MYCVYAYGNLRRGTTAKRIELVIKKLNNFLGPCHVSARNIHQMINVDHNLFLIRISSLN